MSDLVTLLEHHRATAQGGVDLPMMPRLSTVLLTCVDARTDPAHLFGLAPGDAMALRTPGGRVTSGALRDLALLASLASVAAPGARPLEVVVIHHTGCGLSRLADPATAAAVAERSGIDPAEVTELAIVDPHASVAADLARLRDATGPLAGVAAAGFVHDLATGALERISAPAAAA